ncbi:MAG: hypothetical protein A3F72_00340 [Bacteroidetes bacterium RIFCSPLOWO2_12_FULL_35_15]|nr:MAG: hypothetical protein A3F72_00340 [Bacteroidetes bacterium RIFCSPLOWO2_12_FULL_35_15]
MLGKTCKFNCKKIITENDLLFSRMKIIAVFWLVLLPLSSMSQLIIFNDTVTSKSGFVDSTGKQVIPCIYDGTTGFRNGIALCNKDGKYYTINIKGQQVGTFPGSTIQESGSGKAYYSLDPDKKCFFFFDVSGKETSKYNYDHYDQWGLAVDKNVFVITKNEKIGIISDEGQLYVPIEYKVVSDYNSTFSWDGQLYFQDSTCFLLSKNGKHGLISMYGKILIPFDFDTIISYALDEHKNLIYTALKKDGMVMVLNSKLEKINADYDDFYGYFSYYDKSKVVLIKNNRPLLFDCYKNAVVDSFPSKIIVKSTENQMTELYDSLGDFLETKNIPVTTERVVIEKHLFVNYKEKGMLISNKGEILFPLSDVGSITPLNLKNKIYYVVMQRGGSYYALFGPDHKQLTPYQFSTIEVRDKGFYAEKDSKYFYEISPAGVIKKN